MKRVYFVRHGEAEGNALRISQDVHTPLTERGHEQAKVVAERVAQLGIEKIYTSHMGRAIDTGMYIAEVVGIKSEQSEFFGEWLNPTSLRGKSLDSEEYKIWMDTMKEKISDPDWRYEDYENFSDITRRLEHAVELLENNNFDTILVVSHGKFLRLFLAYILNCKELTTQQYLNIVDSVTIGSNTGITLFEVEDKKWKLITWNDLAHFADN